MVKPKRARNEEDKLERRERILEAALALFAVRQYDEITMAEIAGACGLAKGTVYLYFRTKEELFLNLLDRELDAWFIALGDRLAQAAGPWTPAALAALAAETLDARRPMRRLFAIMGTILEHNVDFDTALAFKERVARRAAAGGQLLEGVFPVLAPGEGVPVILQLYALAIGLQQMSEPAPIMQQVLETPHLRAFRPEFRRMLEASVRSLLEGLAAQRAGRGTDSTALV